MSTMTDQTTVKNVNNRIVQSHTKNDLSIRKLKYQNIINKSNQIVSQYLSPS